jgi:AraC family transcriptional regulator
MAPHHLHRTFRAVNGVTLHQWIVGLRLDEAKRLVQETDLPIASVCHRVGYASLPSFTHLFRARFGCPPGAFRRTQVT